MALLIMLLNRKNSIVKQLANISEERRRLMDEQQTAAMQL